MSVIRRVLSIAALLALPQSTALANAEAPSKTDLLQRLHAMVERGIATADLAQKQAKALDVAAFADIVRRDDATAKLILEKQAENLKLTLWAPREDPNATADAPSLADDAAALTQITREHEALLEMVTDARPHAESEDMRLLLENLSTIFENHLKIAKDIAARQQADKPSS